MADIRKAVQTDNDNLVDLLARCPQGTNLVVRLDRAPDFFARSQPYDMFQTFVAEEDGRVVGAVESAIKHIMMDGRMRKVAYHYSLAVDPAYRGKGLAQRLEETCTQYAQSQNADACYVWILEDNIPSLKITRRAGYADDVIFNVHALLPYQKRRIQKGVRPMKMDDLPQIVDLLNRTYSGYDFYGPHTPDTLLSFLHNLPGFDQSDYMVYEDGGRIVSCLGCWDYSKAINGTIIRLSRKLSMLSAAIKVLRVLMPMPRVPELGNNWSYCVPELPGYLDHPGQLVPLFNQLNNFAVERQVNVIMFPLDPKSNLNRLVKGSLTVSVGLHQLVKPLVADLKVSTGRLIYADPIDI